jgi:putative tryptophan/tyrosine transport system substrate-binding protein
MRRRDFIKVIVGSATAWPLSAGAQPMDGAKRIGLLMGWSKNNAEFQGLVATFVEELARLGWVDGRNAQIEERWTDADRERASAFATELVAWRPDVLLSSTTPATAALHRATTTIPIVFTVVVDPVHAGFVASLPRPGGNITGFRHTEPAFAGKWLNLLKELAPGIKHAAIMFNPDTAPDQGNFFLESFESAARSLGVEPITLSVHSDRDIETAITVLGRKQAGLLLADDAFMAAHYPLVISSTLANKVPSIFTEEGFARDGGLASYGPVFKDIFRRAAGYVDRILKGDKPADLPVQQAAKFQLVINLKTAKALDLTVPDKLLAIADEVIE